MIKNKKNQNLIIKVSCLGEEAKKYRKNLNKKIKINLKKEFYLLMMKKMKIVMKVMMIKKIIF